MNNANVQIPDVMIDIETLGVNVNSVIVSIGAVVFKPESGVVLGAPRQAFYRTVNGTSCMRAGLEVDAKTTAWWMQQSEEVRKAVWDYESVPIAEALTDLADWLPHTFEAVWAKGPDFDIAILNNAYRAVDIPVPWDHWCVRDLRTLENIVGKYDRPKRKGVEHHALHDAIYQARCACAAFELLKID